MLQWSFIVLIQIILQKNTLQMQVLFIIKMMFTQINHYICTNIKHHESLNKCVKRKNMCSVTVYYKVEGVGCVCGVCVCQLVDKFATSIDHHDSISVSLERLRN